MRTPTCGTRPTSPSRPPTSARPAMSCSELSTTVDSSGCASIYVATQAWQQDPRSNTFAGHGCDSLLPSPDRRAEYGGAGPRTCPRRSPRRAECPSFLVNGDRYRSEPSEGIAQAGSRHMTSSRFARVDGHQRRSHRSRHRGHGFAAARLGGCRFWQSGSPGGPRPRHSTRSSAGSCAGRSLRRRPNSTGSSRCRRPSCSVAELTEALGRGTASWWRWVGDDGAHRPRRWWLACLRRPARLAPLLVGAPSHGVYPEGCRRSSTSSLVTEPV